MGQKTLTERIQEFEFQPEVYVYPTPRMYVPFADFRLEQAAFTDDINVYVHIPFCKQICSFCGYMKMIDSESLRSEYVDAVAKEIRLYDNILNSRKIKTLHLGGGTPSLLTPTELEKIIASLLKANPDLLQTSQEVSIEATPESIEADKFKKFKELGINRVSLGVQSFDNSEVILSKRHNLSDISVYAVETLRNIGISNVVIDLMIGIEGQNIQSFEKSVKEAIKLMPETIELYALGLMPQTGLGKRLPRLMSDEEIYHCYNVGKALFIKKGYVQDCHNRYIIPKKGSFLQEDYVFRGMSLIGFGAGARSYAANAHYRNSYNSCNGYKAVLEYMKNINDAKHSVESGIFLTTEERMRQYVIGNIEKIDKNEFHQRFGIQFEEQFKHLYQEIIELGLAEDNGMIQLTSKGLIFRDLIAKQFFSEKAKQVEEVYRPRR